MTKCRLKVATSTIANAGDGLFAITEIAQGTVLLPYTGEKSHLQDHGANALLPYAIRVPNTNTIVDAARKRCAASKANTQVHDSHLCNAAFRMLRNDEVENWTQAKELQSTEFIGVPWLVTTQTVPAQSEIFTSYGTDEHESMNSCTSSTCHSPSKIVQQHCYTQQMLL